MIYLQNTATTEVSAKAGEVHISVRLDPTKSEYDVWFDDETGEHNLTITEGVLDCAVDSLSRIKAILVPRVRGTRGPMLPRKNTAQAQLKNALAVAAFQAGLLVAIQRNRHGLRQEDLASQVGLKQEDISAIENGLAGVKITNAELTKLFKTIALDPKGPGARYLAWWRDNG